MLFSTIVFSLLVAGPINYIEDNLIIGYEDGKPKVFEAYMFGTSDDGRPQYLRRDAGEAFADMSMKAFRDGISLSVNYAFRTKAEQRKLRWRTPQLAAVPGHSPHQAGLAVDLNNAVVHGKKTKVFWWLVKHGAEFGFKNTIPNEPWHFEYTLSHDKPVELQPVS